MILQGTWVWQWIEVVWVTKLCCYSSGYFETWNHFQNNSIISLET